MPHGPGTDTHQPNPQQMRHPYQPTCCPKQLEISRRGDAANEIGRWRNLRKMATRKRSRSTSDDQQQLTPLPRASCHLIHGPRSKGANTATAPRLHPLFSRHVLSALYTARLSLPRVPWSGFISTDTAPFPRRKVWMQDQAWQDPRRPACRNATGRLQPTHPSDAQQGQRATTTRPREGMVDIAGE